MEISGLARVNQLMKNTPVLDTQQVLIYQLQQQVSDLQFEIDRINRIIERSQ